MKKNVFKWVAGMALFAALSTGKVYAEEKEIIPMNELPIAEDSDWSEDGEAMVDALKEEQQKATEVETRFSFSISLAATGSTSVEINGIDVSHHQGLIDWQQVKDSGMEFAMIRVGYRGYTYGDIGADTYFETNMENAKEAGMKIGIYFFSQALTKEEALEEASYVIQKIQNYDIDYPVVFDWETAPGYRTYDVGLTKNQMNAMAKEFCDTVESYGFVSMVYSNTVDLQGRYNFESLASKYYIWYARYLPKYGGTTWYQSGDQLPNYDNDITFQMWQYMSDGTVPGISGNCDVNVSFVDFNTKGRKKVTLKPENDKVTVNVTKKLIGGFAAGATYGELKECFPGFTITVNDIKVLTGSKRTLATGDVINFTPSSKKNYIMVPTYTLIIKGDIDMDGKVDIYDLEMIQRHIEGNATLAGAQFRAARIDTSKARITVADLEAVQKHMLGLKSLYE